MPSCPGGRHGTRAHAATRFRITNCERDVSDDEQTERQGEPVVNETGTRSPRQSSEVGEVHQGSGQQHDDDRSGAECTVQLLSGVELGHSDGPVAAATRAQPSPVRRAETIQSPEVGSICGGDEAEQNRDRQRVARVDVDQFDQSPMADGYGQETVVQDCGGGDARQHQNRHGPVDDTFTEAESNDAHAARSSRQVILGIGRHVSQRGRPGVRWSLRSIRRHRSCRCPPSIRAPHRR